jgi:hypothetical protein
MPTEPHRRWEYQVVPFPADDTAHGLAGLNAAGDEGWEAIGAMPKDLNESWMILKREILDEPSPRGRVGFS